jgi:hypothetical protein
MIKKSMNRAGLFFSGLLLFTITIAIAKENTPPSPTVLSAVGSNESSETIILPDEDSTYLNTILSVLGGVGGGGLLLVFLLRRLVTSYDNNFAKWEHRCNNHNQRADEKNDKIISMIDSVQGVAQELKFEIIKLQANAIDKDTVTEALTKVSMLETDVDQVRSEVKSIMTHLLNKPRTSKINNIRS